jgi:hypothetical protein
MAAEKTPAKNGARADRPDSVSQAAYASWHRGALVIDALPLVADAALGAFLRRFRSSLCRINIDQAKYADGPAAFH